MIIKDYKTIFVHIPKNAGTSIETFFKKDTYTFDERMFNRHDTIKEIRWKLECNDKFKKSKEYNKWKKFAIVRNPYDRMVSWYFFYNIKNLTRHADNTSFYSWVKNPTKFNLFEETKYLLKQHYTWIDDTVTILKYENLNEELNNFFNKEIELPIINKTNHKQYLEYYNQESLDVVYEKYKKDFKKFNYKKL